MLAKAALQTTHMLNVSLPSRASLAPTGFAVLLDQRAPQRVRLRGIDMHVGELADQGRIVAAEVDDTVILGPALQFAGVFFSNNRLPESAEWSPPFVG